MPDLDPAIPEGVRQLLLERIDSVAQLELLLLFHGSAPQFWDAEQLSAELRIERSWVEDQVHALCEQGLLTQNPQQPNCYHFQPRSSDLAKHVTILAEMYAERRVSVVALLYS